MALSEDVLKKLISPNAKALVQQQAQAKIGQIVDEGPVGNIKDFDDSMFLAESYNDDYDVPSNNGYVSQAAATKARAMTDYSSNNFNPDRVQNSRMASAILEDMVKHPIDTTALNTQLLESAGNGNAAANNNRLNKMISGARMVEERLNEAPGENVQNKGQVQTGGAGIDYALIKTIINECLETKLNEMAERGLLNEGTTLKGIGLSEGKIKLVDNKGNVFQAKLEYKGNTKDKK